MTKFLRHCSTLIFFLSLCYSITAQEWFKQSDVWVHRTSEGLSGSQGYEERTVVGDTIINGQAAKIIDIHGMYASQQSGSSGEYDFQEVFYEEGGQVYYLDAYEQDFQLVYDFSISVGDSIVYYPLELVCEDSIVYILESIDTMELNDQDLLVQNFRFYDYGWDYDGTRTVIEKIGLVEIGFIPQQAHTCYIDAGGSFLCSFKSGMDSLLFMSLPCYDLPVGTDDIEIEQLRLYPNPTKGMIYIEANEAIELSKVFSLDGRLVESTGVNHSYIDLSRSNLKSGIYIVELHSKKGNISRRRIFLE